MNKWYTYKNGNYHVSINPKTGTKVRENKENYFKADFPESIDVSITQKCDGGCAYCYANCTADGKHGNLNHPFFNSIHPLTEIAINLNDLSHPDLIPFLKRMKDKKIFVNGTINQKHFIKNIPTLQMMCNTKLIHGLGVSVVQVTDEFINAAKLFDNLVLHVINGIITEHDIKKLSGNKFKLLILGYKDVGRGINFHKKEDELIKRNQSFLRLNLPFIIFSGAFSVVSFDNLGLNQLQPRRFLSDKQWANIYMGDDGVDGSLTSASMYVDLVNETFSINSCSDIKYQMTNNIDNMFQHLLHIHNKE